MENTEQKILETARIHFVRYGFAGARMQPIADDAGINKALLHYYFRSKADLYERIVDDIIDTMMPRIASALGSDGGIWDRIEKLVNAYIDTLLESPDIPVFIMGELSQKREKFIGKLRGRMQQFSSLAGFIEKIHDEIEAGNLRSVPPHQLVLSVIGMVVFPFMAKPVFLTLMDMEEQDFRQLMLERKQFVMEFLRNALTKCNDET